MKSLRPEIVPQKKRPQPGGPEAALGAFRGKLRPIQPTCAGGGPAHSHKIKSRIVGRSALGGERTRLFKRVILKQCGGLRHLTSNSGANSGGASDGGVLLDRDCVAITLLFADEPPTSCESRNLRLQSSQPEFYQ
jgi:hypothetical protein